MPKPPKPVRRQLVGHYKGTSVSTEAVHNALRGKLHFHACTNPECRLSYRCSCEQPEDNSLCGRCRGLRPAYDIWRDPQECCINNTVLVGDKKDLIRYQLAGPGPWFQCKTCFRAHGQSCQI